MVLRLCAIFTIPFIVCWHLGINASLELPKLLPSHSPSHLHGGPLGQDRKEENKVKRIRALQASSSWTSPPYSGDLLNSLEASPSKPKSYSGRTHSVKGLFGDWVLNGGSWVPSHQNHGDFALGLTNTELIHWKKLHMLWIFHMDKEPGWGPVHGQSCFLGHY